MDGRGEWQGTKEGKRDGENGDGLGGGDGYVWRDVGYEYVSPFSFYFSAELVVGSSLG